MKKLLSCWLIFIIFNCQADEYFTIDEIYADSKSYDYEKAKNLALQSASLRAFKILLDKISRNFIDTKDLQYQEIADLIDNYDVLRENFIENDYQAVYNFTFNRYKTDELILAKAPISELSKFSEALIIPILKRGKRYIAVDSNFEWIQAWPLKQEELKNKSIILLPDQEIKELTINKDVSKLNYFDLQPKMRSYKAKKAILVIAEYFTDRTNGETSLKLTERILHYKQPIEHTKTYNFAGSSSQQSKIAQIINDFIAKYGLKKNESKAYLAKKSKEQAEKDLKNKISNITIKLEFNLYYQRQQIISEFNKIDEVVDIKKFNDTQRDLMLNINYYGGFENFKEKLIELGYGLIEKKQLYILIKKNQNNGR